jgi:hypothetical protein
MWSRRRVGLMVRPAAATVRRWPITLGSHPSVATSTWSVCPALLVTRALPVLVVAASHRDG